MSLRHARPPLSLPEEKVGGRQLAVDFIPGDSGSAPVPP